MKTTLYICPNGYVGGAESFIFNICESHLQNKKIIPTILFFRDGPGIKKAQELGIKYFLLQTSFKLTSLTYIKASLEIRKIIKQLKPDIIHFTMPYSVVACFIPLLFIKIKKVWFQHGPVGGLLDKVASYLYVDSIFFNSRDTLERHFFYCRDIYHTKKKIIKLGIKSAAQTDILQDNNLFNEANYNLLSAGRICRWKGQHILINSLHLLKVKDHPLMSKVKCYIIGSPNSADDHLYQEELKDLVQQYKLEEHILFLGHQNNMSSFYKKANLLIHTSTIAEPFGLVVAEAMKEGLLVIGSKYGGIQDILIDHQTGLVFDPTVERAHADLADLITASSLFDNSGLIKNAKTLIDNNYSIEQMTDEIEKVYYTI